jgi:nucleotide-binding universal stress UspA family protein
VRDPEDGRKRTLVELMRTEGGRKLEMLLKRLEERGLREVRGRLEAGPARQAIVESAAAGGYDLIVIGTHGRTGLAHVVLGSVAEWVVRHAPVPVLTVRSGMAPIQAAHAPPPAAEALNSQW